MIKGKNRTKDHIIPKSRGGALLPINIAYCCDKCNAYKGNNTPLEWRRKLINRKDHNPPYPRAHIIERLDRICLFVEQQGNSLLKIDLYPVDTMLYSKEAKKKRKYSWEALLNMK